MHGYSLSGTSTTNDLTPVEVERTYRKIFFRLIPLLFLCDVISYIDRVNISFAELQIIRDLDFTESTYGLGAGTLLYGLRAVRSPNQSAGCSVSAHAARSPASFSPGGWCRFACFS